ncbi:hypothetical protein RQP46_001740 [Phenoliferia psychrophenolica]
MEILPATLADADDFARIHREAFAPGPIFVSLLASCTPAALDAHLAARVKLYLSLPDKRLFKAVLDGKTVAWTWWDVPHDGPPVVMPTRTFPEGANVDIATDFFERMASNAAGLMPCYGEHPSP